MCLFHDEQRQLDSSFQHQQRYSGKGSKCRRKDHCPDYHLDDADYTVKPVGNITPL